VSPLAEFGICGQVQVVKAGSKTTILCFGALCLVVEITLLMQRKSAKQCFLRAFPHAIGAAQVAAC
jgi:hypothetical protein